MAKPPSTTIESKLPFPDEAKAMKLVKNYAEKNSLLNSKRVINMEGIGLALAQLQERETIIKLDDYVRAFNKEQKERETLTKALRDDPTFPEDGVLHVSTTPITHRFASASLVSQKIHYPVADDDERLSPLKSATANLARHHVALNKHFETALAPRDNLGADEKTKIANKTFEITRDLAIDGELSDYVTPAVKYIDPLAPPPKRADPSEFSDSVLALLANMHEIALDIGNSLPKIPVPQLERRR